MLPFAAQPPDSASLPLGQLATTEVPVLTLDCATMNSTDGGCGGGATVAVGLGELVVAVATAVGLAIGYTSGVNRSSIVLLADGALIDSRRAASSEEKQADNKNHDQCAPMAAKSGQGVAALEDGHLRQGWARAAEMVGLVVGPAPTAVLAVRMNWDPYTTDLLVSWRTLLGFPEEL